MEIRFYIYYDYARRAGVAQLVEHLIRNEGVVGSSPITGTMFINARAAFFYCDTHKKTPAFAGVF